VEAHGSAASNAQPAWTMDNRVDQIEAVHPGMVAFEQGP
jgi:hypothetical protein